MDISLILATHNGAGTLPRTLSALADLDLQGISVEFLLVDNASTDDTPRLLQAFLGTRPGRFLSEPRPGKSNALNAALAQARGSLIVFTDDDVIPVRGWLLELADAARQLPEIVAFAGQIRLVWPTPPSAWLNALEEMGRTLGATPRDRKRGPVPFSEVKGANCAVRRSALAELTGFRTDLGVSSQGPALAGEETAFFKSLEETGHAVMFVPEAELGHIVRPQQMSLRSLLKRGVRNGRGSAAIDGKPLPPSRMTIAGIPGYGIRNVTRIGLRGLGKFLFGDKVSGACELLRASEIAGSLLEYARRRGDRVPGHLKA